MVERQTQIRQDHLLLVEGREEARFWEALLRHHGRLDIQVESTEGKDNLAPVLRAFVNAPGFFRVTWLGIVQDADLDARAAFQRICSGCRRAALAEPTNPWMPTAGMPIVVAMVLPDGTSVGDLESLVWQAVEREPSAPCVHAFMQCLDALGLAPRQSSKARIHAYLASLPRPDLRLAEAAAAGQLPLGSPVSDPVLRLLP